VTIVTNTFITVNHRSRFNGPVLHLDRCVLYRSYPDSTHILYRVSAVNPPATIYMGKDKVESKVTSVQKSSDPTL
jgi:hypothetical protein